MTNRPAKKLHQMHLAETKYAWWKMEVLQALCSVVFKDQIICEIELVFPTTIHPLKYLSPWDAPTLLKSLIRILLTASKWRDHWCQDTCSSAWHINLMPHFLKMALWLQRSLGIRSWLHSNAKTNAHILASTLLQNETLLQLAGSEGNCFGWGQWFVICRPLVPFLCFSMM